MPLAEVTANSETASGKTFAMPFQRDVMTIGNLCMVGIVDDDGDVRDVLLALLESAGHTVKTYGSGEQLLDDAELGEVACIVVDHRMPNMTGLELLRRIRLQGRTIPSVLITGLPDAEVAKEARALGALDSLSKPIDASRLLTLVGYAAQ
jgi:two-component system, LuxR family, response regulator FixJ